MGHESVETTMIYMHMMQKAGLGVKSPLDRLGIGLVDWGAVAQLCKLPYRRFAIGRACAVE